MQKINFINDSEPSLSEDILNELQENTEEAISDSENKLNNNIAKAILNPVVESIECKNIAPNLIIGDITNFATGSIPVFSASTTRMTFQQIFIDISNYTNLIASINSGFKICVILCDSTNKVTRSTDYVTSYSFTRANTEKYLYIKVKKDDNSEITSDDLSSVELQIEKGNTATSYTPFKRYGYNSQESMGSIVVDDISCKNKFNMNGNILESIDYTSGTNVLESGKIKATANIANGNGKGQIIQLKPNTVYTYSVKISSFEVDGSTSLRISPVNSEGNAVGYLLDQSIICEVGKVYSYSFTTSDTGKIWVMLNGISNVVDYSILKYIVYDYIQIEEGSTATNYSEYKGIGYTSGQNSNGSWVKYDDGTLIQYVTKEATEKTFNTMFGSFYYNVGTETWDYPVAFKDAPVVTATTQFQGYLGGCCISSCTNEKVNFFLYTPSSIDLTAKQVNTKLIAIGRWK